MNSFKHSKDFDDWSHIWMSKLRKRIYQVVHMETPARTFGEFQKIPTSHIDDASETAVISLSNDPDFTEKNSTQAKDPIDDAAVISRAASPSLVESEPMNIDLPQEIDFARDLRQRKEKLYALREIVQQKREALTAAQALNAHTKTNDNQVIKAEQELKVAETEYLLMRPYRATVEDAE
jgi:hypothetical protein